MKIDSYSISKKGIRGVVKGAAIWGHVGTTVFPLVYLRKPKHLSDSDWQEVLDGVRLELKKEE